MNGEKRFKRLTARIAASTVLSLTVVSSLLNPWRQAVAEAPAFGHVMDALKSELNRSLVKLKSAGSAPLYFLAYRVIESNSIDIYSKYGAIDNYSEPDCYRYAQVELRVGAPALDNSHRLPDEEEATEHVEAVSLPIEDNDIATRTALWRATDKAFKSAQKRYAFVRARKDLRVAESDQSADFSMEGKANYLDVPADYKLERKKWDGEIRRLSSTFNEFPTIRDSSVRLTAGREIRYLTTSEGTQIKDYVNSYLINIYADTVAPDGMVIWLFERIESFGRDNLPGEDKLKATIRRMGAQLAALRKAPLAEPYAGPCILKGRAAGVFFHEILGHRLEGHRQKDESESRTFKDRIGKRIMPKFISVVDDPSTRRLNGCELSGSYRFDDEGVAARRVTLVNKGILSSFLMGRSPVDGFSKSNGHGRCDYGHAPVARQGNLMVVADETSRVSYAELRRRLIAETRRQRKPYGLIFDDIAGGSTLTHVGEPQLYKLFPLHVVKVYANGRPDQIIRGVDIVGTPLASLEQIMAAGDDVATFNGVCGAESGWVPVSASSPSLLIRTIEVQRTQKSDEKPPLLPDPLHDSYRVTDHYPSDRRSIR